MTQLLGVAAFVVGVAAARPRPTARGLQPYSRPSVSPLRFVDAIGRSIVKRLPSGWMARPRESGWAMVAGVALLPIAPPLAFAPVAIVLVRVTRRRRAFERSKVHEVKRGLPEVVDLLVLGVGAGLTVRDTLASSVRWMPAPFDQALSECVRRADAGEPFTDSLVSVAADLGPAVRPLVTVLTAAERDGAALVPALERAAEEARRVRRVEAEEAARRVPVLMLFPLVLCVLPAFAVLTVVPVLISTLSDLQLPSAGP